MSADTLQQTRKILESPPEGRIEAFCDLCLWILDQKDRVEKARFFLEMFSEAHSGEDLMEKDLYEPVFDVYEILSSEAGRLERMFALIAWLHGRENRCDRIRRKIAALLEARGVKRIRAAHGARFNPLKHHGLKAVFTSDADRQMTICEEMEKGYQQDNQVIRKAGVSVYRYRMPSVEE